MHGYGCFFVPLYFKRVLCTYVCATCKSFYLLYETIKDYEKYHESRECIA